MIDEREMNDNKNNINLLFCSPISRWSDGLNNGAQSLKIQSADFALTFDAERSENIISITAGGRPPPFPKIANDCVKLKHPGEHQRHVKALAYKAIFLWLLRSGNDHVMLKNWNDGEQLLWITTG